MFSEFKKSINSVLYERVTSPFFGTLVISWILINWKIFVVLFFVDEKILKINKVDYIIKNCNNYNLLIKIPIISTIFLLTIVPFITNGSYWLNLKFQKWRYDKKNSVENSKLLTLEQSLQLRQEIQQQQEKFEKVLQSKNQEIEALNKQIENSTKLQKDYEFGNQEKDEELNSEFLQIFQDGQNLIDFKKIIWKIQNGYKMFSGSDNPRSDFVSYLEANGLLENVNGLYKFTKLGKELQKVYSNITMNK